MSINFEYEIVCSECGGFLEAELKRNKHWSYDLYVEVKRCVDCEQADEERRAAQRAKDESDNQLLLREAVADAEERGYREGQADASNKT